jgi:hypothetical protein
MRRQRQTSQDSLELLLDTLCNVFGGIILITCLLALMNNRKTDDSKQPTQGKGRGQLVEQRLLVANSELQRLKELEVKLNKSDDVDARLLAAERIELEKTLERLRKDKVTEPVNKEAMVIDPGEEIAKLRSKVEAAEAKLAEAASEESALKAKATELVTSIENIKKKIGEKQQARTQKLRFPKEKMQSKPPWHLIIKNGEIYPIHLPSGGAFKGVEIQDLGDNSHKVTAVAGEGLDVRSDREQILSLFGQVAGAGQYLSIIIHRDDQSFETFKSLKDMIFSQKIDYGLMVHEDQRPIQFSATGTLPAPL